MTSCREVIIIYIYISCATPKLREVRDTETRSRKNPPSQGIPEQLASHEQESEKERVPMHGIQRKQLQRFPLKIYCGKDPST